MPAICPLVTATLISLPFRVSLPFGMPLAIGRLAVRILTLVAVLQVGGVNAKIMLRMLVVIFGRYAIAGRRGVPRKS